MRGVEQIPWLYEVVCGLLETTGLADRRRDLVGGARGRVMDPGSGTGRNLALMPSGAKVVAVDPSLDALKWGRRRLPGALRVVARAESLSFRAATFDTVLSGLVFCSVAAPDPALGEVKRVLRRKAACVCCSMSGRASPGAPDCKMRFSRHGPASRGAAIRTATRRRLCDVRASRSNRKGAERGASIGGSRPCPHRRCDTWTLPRHIMIGARLWAMTMKSLRA
jgi:ubiquinone/menaquinone biosynthesis C-methylase UbiE